MHFKIFSVFVLAVCLAFCAISTMATPVLDDLEAAASDHGHGRVQIKVYRGPTEHDGHEHFAPWGFWVKQPADDDHH